MLVFHIELNSPWRKPSPNAMNYGYECDNVIFCLSVCEYSFQDHSGGRVTSFGEL